MPRASHHAKIRRARGEPNETRENRRAHIDGSSVQNAAPEENPAPVEETRVERLARLRAEVDALEKENAE